MHGRWQFGLRKLMLSITLLAVLLGAWVSLGPRARFYDRCRRAGIPRELWARVWERQRDGWTLIDWEPVAGNGPNAYLLHFAHHSNVVPHGVVQSELLWRDPKGWGVWTGDELPRVAGNWWSDPQWIDLTADGAPELIMNHYRGGNSFLSSEVRAFEQHGPALVPVHLPTTESQAVQEVKDLDADGLAELLVTGAELEIFGDRAHYEGLSYRRIYQWDRDANAFRDVSPQFPDYLRQQLAEQLAWSEQTYDEDPADTLKHRARDLAATAVYRWCIGETEHGWKEYNSALSELLAEGEHPGPFAIRSSLMKERQELAELFFGNGR